MRKVWERFGIVLLAGGAAAVLLTLAAIILFLALRGAPALSWEFITAFPRRGMTEGGIFPALVGTLYLVVGTAILAVPLG
ncbi:MAG TPA: phosphate ABC transporter, permease protein PstA, partial [Candidatus Acetothermia bacterium]|nr:phosphate ABC transporter, permease protein PstA [Candidatus Acetothermia bacterium]